MLNYSIIGYNSHLYKSSYNDIINKDNVKFTPDKISEKRDLLCLITEANWITYLFHRINHSPKLNSIVNLPLKHLWFEHYYNAEFSHDAPICFLFFGRNAELEKYGFIKYLKNKYKNSKYVCFFQDIIESHANIDLENLKNTFDLVISFDQKDARNYDFEYFPLVNSRCEVEPCFEYENSEIYFLGAAKNRLNDIINAYVRLKSMKLKCDFYITGVEKKDRVFPNEIHYINSMSYPDNLRHINKTQCILELMQKNGTGYTQRMMEAIVYDKKVITNNPSVKNAPFYNPENILHLDNIDSLPDNTYFFRNFSRNADHAFKNEISPIKLLEFISTKLDT